MPIFFTSAKELSVILDKYEWFYSVEIEKDRLCVYMHNINKGNLSIVPDNFNGHNVVMGFVGYLLCGEKYGKGSIKTLSSFFESEVSDLD